MTSRVRHTTAKDRTFKTVRPNQGTMTDASAPRIGVRRPIRLRPGEVLSVGA